MSVSRDKTRRDSSILSLCKNMIWCKTMTESQNLDIKPICDYYTWWFNNVKHCEKDFTSKISLLGKLIFS